MQFNFDINPLFPNEITKLDGRLLQQETNSCRRYSASSKSLDNNVATVVDAMGDASARAQGLHHSITTSSKFIHSDHTLYVMKDGERNGKKGVVVGILKMGIKRLFLLDQDGCQHEIIPLCVLDFYVHETYQRKGCGKRLFDFMLQDQDMQPQDLAIDRPSEKLLAFLKRHYHLMNPIHQRNNFTVYNGIFSKKLERMARVDEETQWDENGRHSDRRTNYDNDALLDARCPFHRQSYPPAGASSIERSTVASVVFGQVMSSENLHKGKIQMDPLLLHEEDHRHGLKSGLTADGRSSADDSSYNIFGVPSPPNRSGWEAE